MSNYIATKETAEGYDTISLYDERGTLIDKYRSFYDSKILYILDQWKKTYSASVQSLYNPSSEYRFNEGVGTQLTDYSSSANHGTLGAALGATYRPTWNSKGLVFNGAVTVGIPPIVLEGAQTIQVFSKPTLSNQANQLNLIGAIADSRLLYGFAPGDGRPASISNSIYGDTHYASGKPILSGTLCTTFRQDGKVFINDTEAPYYATPVHGYPPYSPLSNVTEAYIGSWTQLFGPFVGEIYYVNIWKRLLSVPEIIGSYNYVKDILSRRGINLGYNSTLTNTLFAFEGDSMTRNYNADVSSHAFSQKALSLLAGNYHYLNLAIGGSGSQELIDRAASQLDPVLRGFTGDSVLTVFIGTNENWGPTYTNILTYAAARKAAGWKKIVAITGLPRFAADTPRLSFNTQLKAYSGPLIDKVFDWAADPNMGQTGQYITAYYADQLHPSTSGHAIGGTGLAAIFQSMGYT